MKKTNEIVLEFDLPQFERKDIDVRVSRDSVTVVAEKKMNKQIKKKDFFHRESSSSNFTYSTSIPEINPKKAKIEFKKGVLKITAPRF
jgi:HSP20 family protein